MAIVVVGAVFCYLTQMLAGWLGWRLLGGGATSRAVAAGAALIVGPGLVTVQMVAYHALGVPFAVLWLALPWWGGLVAWRLWGSAPPAPRRDADAGVHRRAVVVAVVATVLTLAIAAQAFSLPIHDGDEVNNFALFAKVFGSLGSLAPARLSTLMEPGHVEYPHLVALNQAWLFALDADSAPWTARGFEVLGAVAFFAVGAGAFSLATWAGVAGCIVCLASPAVLHVAVGFFDVRLLATFVLLGQQAPHVLAGHDRAAPLRYALVLGTAALTKNEGLAVAGAGTLVLLVAMLRQRTWARGLAALSLAACLLALWPVVRRGLGMSMPYVERAFALPLDVLVAQTPRVVAAFARLMFPIDSAGLLHAGLFFWIAAPLALWSAARDVGARWLCGAWFAHLALYTYVLGIARPGDLDALLGTAAPRLVLHTMAWPLLILARAAPRL